MWVALNLTLLIFMHYDFMRSMGWCKKDVTPFLTHLSCVFLALTHRNEKNFLHADFYVSLIVARTTFWTNTRVAGELRFHSLWFIHFSRPTCMWNSAEIFPGFSPEFNRNIRRSWYKYWLRHWGRDNDGWCFAHIFNTFSWHEID